MYSTSQSSLVVPFMCVHMTLHPHPGDRWSAWDRVVMLMFCWLLFLSDDSIVVSMAEPSGENCKLGKQKLLEKYV